MSKSLRGYKLCKGCGCPILKKGQKRKNPHDYLHARGCPKCHPTEMKATAPSTSALATQVGGDHYKEMPIQPWEVMKAWMSPEEFSGFLRGCVIKYVSGRSKGEPRIVDYKKARHCLDALIELEGGK